MNIAVPDLLATVYQKREKTCMYGVCHYCASNDAICGVENSLEGTVILWLPSNKKLAKHRHPWQRSYKKDHLAAWETNQYYCDQVLYNILLRILSN